MHDPRDDEFPALTEPVGAAPGGEAGADLGALAPGAVRRERLLGVSADAAWELLRDADGLSRWLADEVDVVVAPGECGQLRDEDGTAREVAIDEVEEGRRVALRWWSAEGEESVVDLVLDDVDGAARLTVTEIPLRVVAVPDAVPLTWTRGGDTDQGGPTGTAGAQPLALACR